MMPIFIMSRYCDIALVDKQQQKNRMISIYFILFLLISILTSSYGQFTCPSGWVQNGESCYLFSQAFNSWWWCFWVELMKHHTTFITWPILTTVYLHDIYYTSWYITHFMIYLHDTLHIYYTSLTLLFGYRY
jgi:hypothetical protein